MLLLPGTVIPATHTKMAIASTSFSFVSYLSVISFFRPSRLRFQKTSNHRITLMSQEHLIWSKRLLSRCHQPMNITPNFMSFLTLMHQVAHVSLRVCFSSYHKQQTHFVQTPNTFKVILGWGTLSSANIKTE